MLVLFFQPLQLLVIIIDNKKFKFLQSLILENNQSKVSQDFGLVLQLFKIKNKLTRSLIENHHFSLALFNYKNAEINLDVNLSLKQSHFRTVS